MADEKAILSKLEAAELRIGMCDEKALTKLLDPALPNLLPFLGSPFASVRTKTMAILSHLNKRIKGDATIQLPLEGLRKAFAAATSPLVANFALVYLEMGFPRAASTERASLVPPLLVGISSRPAAQQETLLGLLAITLSVLPLPKIEAELQGPAATLPFLSAAADRKLTLEWCRDMLLYLPPLSELPAAGLSPDAAKRVCGRLADNEVRGELLAAKKLAICRLLSAQTDDGKHKLFSTAETLSHWVIAACDSNGNIALHAETALRQASDADLEEAALVDELVVLLLGAEGQKRLPASVPVQLRAIALLQKSVAAAGRFPGILQVIFTTIFNGRPPRLAEAGCRLSTWVASHAPLPMLAAVGAHLLAGMVKVLHADGIGEVRVDSNEAIAMRSAAYATLTALCQRLPAIVAADLELPANLFHALAVEQVGARSALQEALAALAEVHAASSTRPTGAQQHALQALLLRAAAADSHHSRYCAMIWAGKAFASDDVIARYICFLGLGDERREVHEASLRSLRPPRSAAVTPGAPAPPPPPLEAGQRVSHRDGRGDVRTGIIAQLHSHGGEAYYTVALDGGGEVQTEAAHLARLAPGWPSLRACVGCVVANTALRPPPRAVGEWLLAETAALQA
ncbi:hypothetical protein AB1Y20_009237 [Prymnesium parvum]|uniref:Proteasome component Ecm29 N-terminal domain-containing protein n=1 Tax=Prymnesium parvum TaxID=97485 RepID=A0AB34K487_PRYPA